MERKRLIILLGIVIFLSTWLLVQIKLQVISGFRRPTPKKTYKIRIGCSSLTPIHCMFGEIFQRTDILRKHGLDGEISFFIHGGDQSQACRSDQIDATFSCEVPAISQLMNCPDLRIIGTPGSLGRIALIVPRQSKVFSLQDLKSKTILIHEGSSATMMMRKWLQGSGLDPDRDVKLIYSDKDTILNRLYSAEGDAIVSWDPWLEIFLEKHNFRIIKERLFRSVVVVMQGYLQKYPEAVIRYEAALKDAFLWGSDNKKTVVRWISAQSGIEQNIVENVMELNENWVLPEDERRTISLSLTQEDIKILEECNNYVIKIGQIPLDFDVKKKINLGVFNK